MQNCFSTFLRSEKSISILADYHIVSINNKISHHKTPKTMSKLFLLASLPLLFFFSNASLDTASAPNNGQEEQPGSYEVGIPGEPRSDASSRTIADLSAAEKAAFFKHIIETGDCEWKGIELKGKVQFVTSFPDIKIQYVSSFPDINVKFVSSFPDDCGEWQEVNSFPDFKVQVVSSFPDLKVKKVTSFPGMN